jgi:hypothetical protein
LTVTIINAIKELKQEIDSLKKWRRTKNYELKSILQRNNIV